MDNTVRVWDLETGTCLHTLSGHTSLVGLLGSSTNHIVSAAADASVRVWDGDTCELKHALTGHAAAITCFQHDENKVVSGSDGALKLWDIRTGKPVRDLISGINSVWQVAFKDNLLVAASNRSGSTVFDVFDFGAERDPYGVDDNSLDSFKRKPWERNNPHEPQTYQNDEIYVDDLSDALSPTTAERWRTLFVDPNTSSKPSKGSRKLRKVRRPRESRETRNRDRDREQTHQAQAPEDPDFEIVETPPPVARWRRSSRPSRSGTGTESNVSTAGPSRTSSRAVDNRNPIVVDGDSSSSDDAEDSAASGSGSGSNMVASLVDDSRVDMMEVEE
jgi:F-box and WD-40 domain protein CDC4